MDMKKFARLNFRLSREEFDALDRVIARMNYETKTHWLKAHLLADRVACGDLELSDTEKALLSVGDREKI